MELAEEVRQRAMRGSVVEGASYAVMVGFGEIYFVADALRLGAEPVALGMVVALPLFVGSLGALAAHALGSRGYSRKRVTVAGTTGQVSVLLALALAEYFGRLTPGILIFLVSLYHLCGQIAGVTWASWFGDIVSESERGKYFAKRNRVVHTSICLSVFAAGGCLQLIEGSGANGVTGNATHGTGYVLIFAVAALFRLLSTTLLVRTPEPHADVAQQNPIGALRSALSTQSFARRVVGTTAALYLGVYIASPYFAPHMLDTLQFSYIEYTLASVASVVARVTLLPAWGRMLDQHAARSSFLVALVGIAIIPIPWLLSGHLAVVLFAQALSGVFWGGHELSQFTMILECVRRDQRVAVFAALGAIAGAAQLLGTLIGAAVMEWGGFVTVVVVSGCARALVALFAPGVLPEASQRPHAPRRVILLRLAGLRPSGGLTHRPLSVNDGD